VADALDAAAIARGRGRAYALLADLVSRGPTESTLDAARASDGLAAALASYPDLDEAAAAHQHAFGLSVPPYEGAFLDAEGSVGGDCTSRLRDRFRSMGFVNDPRAEGPEHLATQLRALAFLSAAEADAQEDERADALEVIEAHARGLLDAHLLRWLPSFVAAVNAMGSRLPSALVDQVVDVVLMHRSGLAEPAPEDQAFELGGDPLDLDDESLGVREIAAALAVAARVGALVGRDDVARVGRSQRVPRGFGERRTLIHNLLRTSVSLGSMPEVIDGLRSMLRDRRDALSDPRYLGVPGLEGLLTPWRKRLVQTEAQLSRLAQAGRAEPMEEAVPT